MSEILIRYIAIIVRSKDIFALHLVVMRVPFLVLALVMMVFVVGVP